MISLLLTGMSVVDHIGFFQRTQIRHHRTHQSIHNFFRWYRRAWALVANTVIPVMSMLKN